VTGDPKRILVDLLAGRTVRSSDPPGVRTLLDSGGVIGYDLPHCIVDDPCVSPPH
jgi:hypothetical protein